MKSKKFNLLSDMGLCLSDGVITYGMDHGVLRWAPEWVKHTIAHVWNRSRCLLLGHDPRSYEMYTKHVIPDAPRCTNCSTPLKINERYPTPEEIEAHNILCEEGWKLAEEKWRTEHPEEYQQHLEEMKRFEKGFPLDFEI